MGSDTFSLPVLQALIEQGHSSDAAARLVGVVTQPDRPAGRGRRIAGNVVKAAAIAADLPVLQPHRLREVHALQQLTQWAPELIVVASFGQILPRSVLQMPRHGSLNLHPSLLPRYRGSSPIVAPLLAGDRVTGTTLMLMSAQMDAGPILAQESTPIANGETAGELESRLAQMSADLLLRELPGWLDGKISPVSQDESLATYTQRVEKSDGQIDWTLPAEVLALRVRAFNPWPAAHTSWRGGLLRVLRAGAIPGSGEPGLVLRLQDGRLLIGTGVGILAARELQLAGGRPLDADTFVRGHSDIVGNRLG